MYATTDLGWPLHLGWPLPTFEVLRQSTLLAWPLKQQVYIYIILKKYIYISIIQFFQGTWRSRIPIWFCVYHSPSRRQSAGAIALDLRGIFVQRHGPVRGTRREIGEMVRIPKPVWNWYVLYIYIPFCYKCKCFLMIHIWYPIPSSWYCRNLILIYMAYSSILYHRWEHMGTMAK
jgi:hypothetical protein